MIYKAKHEITEYYRGKTAIVEVYHGKYLVWQIISSCYGRGYWINDEPWSNTDAWVN